MMEGNIKKVIVPISKNKPNEIEIKMSIMFQETSLRCQIKNNSRSPNDMIKNHFTNAINKAYLAGILTRLTIK